MKGKYLVFLRKAMKQIQGIFVTGTGTDIGKTSACLVLCLWAIAQGRKVAYYKPVQSGVRTLPDGRKQTDLDWVRHMCPFPLPARCTYNFHAAVSPHLASRMENRRISFPKIREDFAEIAAEHDLVVMEGAGGIAVPLTPEGANWADLIEGMPLHPVIICSPGLGTLNHTLLTHQFLAARSQAPSFAMCHAEEEIPIVFEDNVDSIKNLTGMKYFGEVKFSRQIEASLALETEEVRALFEGFTPAFKTWFERDLCPGA